MKIILFTLLCSMLTVFTEIFICLLIQLVTIHLWDISYESVGKGPEKKSYSIKKKFRVKGSPSYPYHRLDESCRQYLMTLLGKLQGGAMLVHMERLEVLLGHCASSGHSYFCSVLSSAFLECAGLIPSQS